MLLTAQNVFGKDVKQKSYKLLTFYSEQLLGNRPCVSCYVITHISCNMNHQILYIRYNRANLN